MTKHNNDLEYFRISDIVMLPQARPHSLCKFIAPSMPLFKPQSLLEGPSSLLSKSCLFLRPGSSLPSQKPSLITPTITSSPLGLPSLLDTGSGAPPSSSLFHLSASWLSSAPGPPRPLALRTLQSHSPGQKTRVNFTALLPPGGKNQNCTETWGPPGILALG